MHKTLFPLAALASLLLSGSAAQAQPTVTQLYFDTRASFHQEVADGRYFSQFTGDHFNLNIRGTLTDKLDFRIRQRLNKKVFDERNMFNATDFLYLRWQATPRWAFTVGKNAVLIGGYEFDAVPIDVYYYSNFCNNLYQGFAFGVNAEYALAEEQTLGFQVCNSPLSLGFQNLYAFNFAWTGRFAPWWSTLWSVNFVQDEFHRTVNYIALGNRLVFGDLAIDVEWMNRAGAGQRNFFSDYTVISKIIWTVGKWNLCAKGGYESNDIANVDAAGRALDLAVAPGTRNVYAGCGVEFFPLPDRDRLRLHAVYFKSSSIGVDNFDIGITWRLDIIKR
ncbi:Phosphate-selective porin O and P [Bacteroidales bacterium WCE2004]|nr:Phosphate-selective porin O and P [Bacteroidales bacterium WCE2004]